MSIKKDEITQLRSLVDQSLKTYSEEIILNKDRDDIDCLKIFDDFYISYNIPSIGKEMDLLKINENIVLNIELKSRDVTEDKIQQQLEKNRYYLTHLKREIVQYSYLESENQIYFYNQTTNQLVKSDINSLVNSLKKWITHTTKI